MPWIWLAVAAFAAIWLLVQAMLWVAEHPWVSVPLTLLWLGSSMVITFLRPKPRHPSALRREPPRHDGRPSGMTIDQKD